MPDWYFENILYFGHFPVLCDQVLISEVADSLRRSVSLEQFAITFSCLFFFLSQAQYCATAVHHHHMLFLEMRAMTCRREKLRTG